MSCCTPATSSAWSTRSSDFPGVLSKALLPVRRKQGFLPAVPACRGRRPRRPARRCGNAKRKMQNCGVFKLPFEIRKNVGCGFFISFRMTDGKPIVGGGVPVCHCEPVTDVTGVAIRVPASPARQRRTIARQGDPTGSVVGTEFPVCQFLLLTSSVVGTRLDLPAANCIRPECRAAADRPYGGRGRPMTAPTGERGRAMTAPTGGTRAGNDRPYGGTRAANDRPYGGTWAANDRPYGR